MQILFGCTARWGLGDRVFEEAERGNRLNVELKCALMSVGVVGGLQVRGSPSWPRAFSLRAPFYTNYLSYFNYQHPMGKYMHARLGAVTSLTLFFNGINGLNKTIRSAIEKEVNDSFNFLSLSTHRDSGKSTFIIFWSAVFQLQSIAWIFPIIFFVLRWNNFWFYIFSGITHLDLYLCKFLSLALLEVT